VAIKALEAAPSSHSPLLAPLRARGYVLAWSSRTLSLMGDAAQAVVVSAIVLDLTAAVSAWGVVLALQAIPRTLLMLVGGLAVDRFRPRAIMVASNLLMAGAVVALALPGTSGTVQLAHLYFFALLFGVAQAFFMPASASIVPDLVPAEQVRSANALWMMAFNVARFLAPPLAGALLALSGHGAGLVLVAGLFLGSTLLLLPVESAPSEAPTEAGGPWQRLAEGLRAARRDEVVWPTVLVVAVLGLGSLSASLVGLPALAKLTLAAGDQGVGLLLGAVGAGALLGAAAAGAAARLTRPAAMGCGAIVGTGLALALAGLAPSLAAAMALLLLSGALASAASVIFWTLVHARTPRHVRGRVTALTTLALFGPAPIAFALAALVGDALGPRAVVVAGGLVVALAGAAGLLVPALRRAESSLAPVEVGAR
jgi:MFS family permease